MSSQSARHCAWEEHSLFTKRRTCASLVTYIKVAKSQTTRNNLGGGKLSETTPCGRDFFSLLQESKMKMKVWCCVLLVGLLAVVVSAQRGPECPVCDRTACEKVSEDSCPAGVLLDECGCCQICGRKLDQNCGGKFWNLGRCGRDYYCSGPHPGKAINIGKGEVGFCRCRESKRVCGNDGIVYENFCTLNESSHEQRKYGGNKIEVSRNRKICRSAPRINMVTPSNSTATTKRLGEQTYMQCEGEGFPAPFISWTKDGATLPGDHTNIAVQTIGGPQENQATGWLLISPVTEADAGEYTCEVTNGEGDILRATMFLEVADA